MPVTKRNIITKSTRKKKITIILIFGKDLLWSGIAEFAFNPNTRRSGNRNRCRCNQTLMSVSFRSINSAVKSGELGWETLCFKDNLDFK